MGDRPAQHGLHEHGLHEHGLHEHDLSVVPPEEVRFGVVLNGGVSLAVWMGGVALELDRLVKAPGTGTPYAALLRLAGCTARVDVIAGTSAGGVNGAALALAQVNGHARLATLRDVWVEQGRIEALLRQPFRGAPSSLLKGDDHFLPQLNAALTRLASPTRLVPPREAPIDLTMMTTVLHGNQEVTVDSLGQRLPQSVHAARFHWKRPVDATEEDDPFGVRRILDTAAQLALAARGSSSFPLAFEPAFVPVSSGEGAPTGTPRQTSDLRPDMDSLVEEWGDVFPARDRSRFVVDGGVLANTPTRVAIGAIERMPADGPVRRVMLLVYPHAPAPGADPADTLAAAPTLTGTLTGVLGAPGRCPRRAAAPSSTSSRTTTSGQRAAVAPGPTSSAGSTSRSPPAGCRRWSRWGSSCSRTTAGSASGTPPGTWPGARSGSVRRRRGPRGARSGTTSASGGRPSERSRTSRTSVGDSRAAHRHRSRRSRTSRTCTPPRRNPTSGPGGAGG